MILQKYSKVSTTGGRTIPAILALLTSIFVVASSQQGEVIFQFREEQDATAYVGNFAMEAQRAGILSQQDFSRLRFHIYDSAYFAINETTGAVTTTKKLDRETICPGERDCNLEVEVTIYKPDANDNYDLFKILKFVVSIQDLNDNAPTFPSSIVSLSISEGNAIGDVLRTSGANDPDTGRGNSVKQYSFLDNTDLFSLNVIQNPDGSSYLGIVVEDVLDREKRDFYQVTVIATDGGFPTKSGQVVINITVTDANDNPPEFSRQSYNESVMENVDLNTPIMKVEAKDIDAGMNAEISYKFSSQVSETITNKLYVDEQTGDIFAQSAIDYEENKVFQFVIEASDHGLPQYTSRVGVTLHVIDVNDNTPQININLAPTGTEISELEQIGKFIAHVSVQDRDEGINKVVLCDIDDPYFSLEKFDDFESNMYKVVLQKPLGHMELTRHKVTITCTDSGSPPKSNSSSILVNIIDENDNKPVFTEPVYYGNILENRGGTIPLVAVEAHDLDSGNNGKVTYSIEDRYNGMFRINSTSGTISVFGPLDREARVTYEFHVIARDYGDVRLSSSSLVIITVLDENDEPPLFLKPVYFGDVLENQPSETQVGSVTATDYDDVSNSNMQYSILSDANNRDGDNFSINSKTGVIKSKTVFDREMKSQYNFRVRVVDPTNPGFFDTCNFTVRVIDDNDHWPIINFGPGDNASYVINYTTLVGAKITEIDASDGDARGSKHSTLEYRIVEGDPGRLFSLNRRTGKLSLGRLIRSKDPSNYHIVIQVEDGGDPPKFDTLDVYIRINGTKPSAAGSSSSAGVGQNALIVIIIVVVTIFIVLAVITVICLVKKIDGERRRGNHANANGGAKGKIQKFEDKMYQIKQDEIFTRGTIDITDDANGNSSRKHGSKKEVSFSFDEETDSHNTSTGSGQPLTTSFRAGQDKVKQNGHYGGGTSSNQKGGGGNRAVSDSNINGPMEHPDKPGGTQRHSSGDEESHLIEILRKSAVEDALSESSGESDPSDSGRGGSEDDSSNRGSGLDPEHMNGMYPPVPHHRGGKSLDHHPQPHHHHPHHQQKPPQQSSQHLYPSRGRNSNHHHQNNKGRQLNRLSPLTQQGQGHISSSSPRDSLSSEMDSDILSITTGSRRTDSERSTNPILPNSRDDPSPLRYHNHHHPHQHHVTPHSTNEITPYRGSRDQLHRWNSSGNTAAAPSGGGGGGSGARDSPHRLSAPYNGNISSSHNNILRSFQRQPSSSSNGSSHQSYNSNNNHNNNNNNNHSNNNPNNYNNNHSFHHSHQNINNSNNNDNLMSSFSMERLPPASSHHHPHHHAQQQHPHNLPSDRSRSTTPSDRPPVRYRNSDHYGPSVSDRRMNAMSLAEEDDRTTTSGSYSITADEIRQDIDELILHDSIV